MNLMDQILASFRNMSDEDVAKVLVESVVEFLDSGPHEPAPSFLDDAEIACLDDLLSSLLDDLPESPASEGPEPEQST